MEKMQTAAEKQRRRQMKPGNITQTAWNRSVKKQLHTEMRYSVFRPSPEENCSGLRVASEDGQSGTRLFRRREISRPGV